MDKLTPPLSNSKENTICNTYIKLPLSYSYRIFLQSYYDSAIQKVGCEIYFHPTKESPLQFYSECNENTLNLISCEQLKTILFIMENNLFYTPKVFYKVEPRVLIKLVPLIVDVAERLSGYNVELIVDIHERLLLSSNKVVDAVQQLKEANVDSCLGGYEWEVDNKRLAYVESRTYKYIRLANPPQHLRDANNFLDICFNMVEKFGASLIIDKVQSRAQFNLTK
jgi:hypothetical protein